LVSAPIQLFGFYFAFVLARAVVSGSFTALSELGPLVTAKIQDEYMSTLLTNWKVSSLPMLVNFGLVPPSLRVIFANCYDLVWTVILSILTNRRWTCQETLHGPTSNSFLRSWWMHCLTNHTSLEAFWINKVFVSTISFASFFLTEGRWKTVKYCQCHVHGVEKQGSNPFIRQWQKSYVPSRFSVCMLYSYFPFHFTSSDHSSICSIQLFTLSSSTLFNNLHLYAYSGTRSGALYAKKKIFKIRLAKAILHRFSFLCNLISLVTWSTPARRC